MTIWALISRLLHKLITISAYYVNLAFLELNSFVCHKKKKLITLFEPSLQALGLSKLFDIFKNKKITVIFLNFVVIN